MVTGKRNGLVDVWVAVDDDLHCELPFTKDIQLHVVRFSKAGICQLCATLAIVPSQVLPDMYKLPTKDRDQLSNKGSVAQLSHASVTTTTLTCITWPPDAAHMVRVPLLDVGGASNSRDSRDSQKLYKSQIRLEALSSQQAQVFRQADASRQQPRRVASANTEQVSSYTMFQVGALLSTNEALKMMIFAESGAGPQGFQQEYSQQYRSGSRLLFKSEELALVLWERVKPLVSARDVEDARPSGFGTQGTWVPTGVNTIFRVAKYEAEPKPEGEAKGQGFQRHLDAGFCLTNENRSIWSLLVYLSDDSQIEGGETTFWANPQAPDTVTHRVRPVRGDAVVFNHNISHQGNVVTRGCKYVLRCDIMFSLVEALPPSVAQEVARDPRYYLVRHLYQQCIEAARDNRPQESTAAFIQALDALEFSRRPVLLADEARAVQSTWAKLDDNTLFHLLSCFLTTGEVVRLGASSRYLRRRCRNSQLWKLMYTRRWPEAARLEARRLPSDATNPALVSYKQLYQAQAERRPSRSATSLYIHFGRRSVRVLFSENKNENGKEDVRLVLPNVAIMVELDMADYWGYHSESHQVVLDPQELINRVTVHQSLAGSDIDWLVDDAMFEVDSAAASNPHQAGWETTVKTDWLTVCVGELFKCLASKLMSEEDNANSQLERVVVSCSRPYTAQFGKMLEGVCSIQAKACFPVKGRIGVHFVERAVVTILHALSLTNASAERDGADTAWAPNTIDTKKSPIGIVLRSGFRTSSIEVVRDNRIVASRLLPNTGSFEHRRLTASSHEEEEEEDDDNEKKKQDGLFVAIEAIQAMAEECENAGAGSNDDVPRPIAEVTARIRETLQQAIVQVWQEWCVSNNVSNETRDSNHIVLTGGNMLVAQLGASLHAWLKSPAFASKTACTSTKTPSSIMHCWVRAPMPTCFCR